MIAKVTKTSDYNWHVSYMDDDDLLARNDYQTRKAALSAIRVVSRIASDDRRYRLDKSGRWLSWNWGWSLISKNGYLMALGIIQVTEGEMLSSVERFRKSAADGVEVVCD